MPNALVTGTSTGIGEACARRLAEKGWTVFAGVRNDADADRVKNQIPGDVRPVRLDVTNRAQMHEVIADITAGIGAAGLQALVNNAGVGSGGPFEHTSEDEWRWVFDANLFGVVALTLAAIPILRVGGGRIVHIGSISGRFASAGLGPYSASKHALEAVAETQRHEFARSGTPIHVSLIEPGEVKTAMWAKGEDTLAQTERALDEEGRRRYAWLLDVTRGFLDEGQQRGVAPSKVADAIEHALTASRPKARYLVGPNAKLSGHLIGRLPDRTRDALMQFAGKRWERSGAKLRAQSR